MSDALILLQGMETGETFALKVPGLTSFARLRLYRADGVARYETDALTPAEVEEIREWMLSDAPQITGKVLN